MKKFAAYKLSSLLHLFSFLSVVVVASWFWSNQPKTPKGL